MDSEPTQIDTHTDRHRHTHTQTHTHTNTQAASGKLLWFHFAVRNSTPEFRSVHLKCSLRQVDAEELEWLSDIDIEHTTQTSLAKKVIVW